jgi:hypothetical protein
MRRFADQTPMIDAPRPVGASRPVNLARESDFRLGTMLVRPSLREVCCPTRKHTLEPRVMQSWWRWRGWTARLSRGTS